MDINSSGIGMTASIFGSKHTNFTDASAQIVSGLFSEYFARPNQFV